MDRAGFRTQVLARHLHQPAQTTLIISNALQPSICLQYEFPVSEPLDFDTKEMRKLIDDHNLSERDWLHGLMLQNPELFSGKQRGKRVFLTPDYNKSMEHHREMTMRRIGFFLKHRAFQGWLTQPGPETELRKFALLDVAGSFDHSIGIKLGVHFLLW